MSELNIQLSANDLALFKSYRKEYAEAAASIAALKQDQKDVFEALFDKLGMEKKEHSQEMKAIKKAFSLYVKQSADEELNLISEAAELANL